MNTTQSKIRATHLARSALLYVRQSTMRQVLEHAESTKRQYALRQRAIALGWPEDRVTVIDGDLGQSGASSVDRLGFQQLVAEVSMRRAGLVMGLEVSRLARNNADWHQLLELCALTDTLILDEEGIYEPAHFNDRLLLGLKGTMSEAELHVLRSRMRGGIENKARRGELKVPLPVGLVYDARDHVVIDPDLQVQQSIHSVFATFARVGTAAGTVRHFANEELLFPRRFRSGPNKGALGWGALTLHRLVNILRNPRYAGAYAFGRTRQRLGPDQRRHLEKVPRAEWLVLIPDAHAGYVTWDRHLEILERLQANASANGSNRRTPPREGPALLQGLMVCGRCGSGMTVRYDVVNGKHSPRYLCQSQRRFAKSPCQSLPGAALDAAIGELVVEAVSPTALEASLDVQRELSARIEEADQLRHRQVERAQYEAQLARRRFLRVDPDNRLVADTLEADYNDALRGLAKAREDYERQRKTDQLELTDEAVARVRALATDFPRLWNEPTTPARERKRMVRLIIEDATLTKSAEGVTMQVRFRGGATRTVMVPRSLASWETWQTSPEVIELIDHLLDDHTNAEVAAILNERGYASGQGKRFHGHRIKYLIRAHRLRPRFDRLAARGLLTTDELAARLNTSPNAVRQRRREGTLTLASYRLDDNGRHMFEPPRTP